MKFLILMKLRNKIIQGNNIFKSVCITFGIASYILPAHADVQAASENEVPAPTISQIVSEIESNNLSLRQTSASNEAEEMTLRAENTVGPTSIEYSPFFRSGVTGLASSELIVRQEFDFPTQYSDRSKAIALKRSSLEAALDQQRRMIRIDATKACIDYIALKKEHEILSQRLAATDTLVELYTRKFDARESTILELNKIKLSKQDLEREILQNGIDASEIESQLTILNAGKPLNLGGLDYEDSIDAISLPVSANDYAVNLPSVKAAEAEVRSSIKETQIAGRSWLPTISVGYRRNTEASEASNGFLIGLDFPIFSLGKRKQAARAKQVASEMELTASLNAMESEVSSTITRLGIIRNALNSYDLNLINQTIDLYSQSLRLGQITLTEYYQEIDQLYDRLLTRAALEHEYRRLAASLLP